MSTTMQLRKVGKMLIFAVSILALLTSAALFAATTPVLAGSGSGGSSGDFSLSAEFETATGQMVRGGLEDCPDCLTSVEPRYLRAGSFSCFYTNNTITLFSFDDFEGTVILELLNLPAGVVSETATSLFVPKGGPASTPLRLRADAGAALGDFTITVRATSGNIVHSLDLPVSVVDALPPVPCDNPPNVTITSPTGGSTVSGVVAFSADAVDSGSVNNGIAEVRFRVDGVEIGVDTTEPYAVDWDTTIVGDGQHELRASAKDLGDNITTAIVNVTVSNGGGGADTVGISRAEYDSGKQELRVEATSTDSSATLQVFVTTTDELIGTLNNKGGGDYRGQFSWPVNPQNITVKSSSGGSDSVNVTLK